MTNDDLARRIADVALLRGEFTLRSGRKSSYYLDKYLFSTRPEILGELGKLFAARLPAETTKLAGAELGGIPLVTASSLASGLPSVFIRNSKKEYGTAKQLEGALAPDDQVVIVEDVATTGGQVLEAAKVIEESGARVIRIIATIDRLEGARENIERAGYAFDALFTARDLGVGE
ncbi:MAG TPA: orotate phosphoribosyltransferase [Candidatus Binatia bacterium]|nr:orotate phosphoribosyltransferase [Candidatus Binatia bacterium]